MLMALWVSLGAVAVVGGLGVTLVVWLIRSEVRERRRARFVAQLAETYRKSRPALPSVEPKQPELEPPSNHKVTVEELLARVKAEGLAVRLRWSEDEDGPDEDDWPTGVLPRPQL